VQNKKLYLFPEHHLYRLTTRLSFPLTTFRYDKAQNLSLKEVGTHLREELFSHGQFYETCLEVGSEEGLHILAPLEKATNVVYNDVLC
jgi:hypothetical protein